MRPANAMIDKRSHWQATRTMAMGNPAIPLLATMSSTGRGVHKKHCSASCIYCTVPWMPPCHSATAGPPIGCTGLGISFQLSAWVERLPTPWHLASHPSMHLKRGCRPSHWAALFLLATVVGSSPLDAPPLSSDLDLDSWDANQGLRAWRQRCAAPSRNTSHQSQAVLESLPLSTALREVRAHGAPGHQIARPLRLPARGPGAWRVRCGLYCAARHTSCVWVASATPVPPAGCEVAPGQWCCTCYVRYCCWRRWLLGERRGIDPSRGVTSAHPCPCLTANCAVHHFQHQGPSNRSTRTEAVVPAESPAASPAEVQGGDGSSLNGSTNRLLDVCPAPAEDVWQVRQAGRVSACCVFRDSGVLERGTVCTILAAQRCHLRVISSDAIPPTTRGVFGA